MSSSGVLKHDGKELVASSAARTRCSLYESMSRELKCDAELEDIFTSMSSEYVVASF